jgi:hypothetical protein
MPATNVPPRTVVGAPSMRPWKKRFAPDAADGLPIITERIRHPGQRGNGDGG